MKTITATYEPQEWIDDEAIACDGRREYDMITEVLDLAPAAIRALKDFTVQSDALFPPEITGHDGPFSALLEASICEFFDVEALAAITDEAVEQARPTAYANRAISDVGYWAEPSRDDPTRWNWIAPSDASAETYASEEEALRAAWEDAAEQARAIAEVSGEQWVAMSAREQANLVAKTLADDD